MLGSASDKALEDMLAYAHDTQHEKIIRGLAVGIALIMAGRLEQADTLIQTMVLDKVLKKHIIYFQKPFFKTIFCIGSHSQIWWYVHDSFGLLWYLQRRGNSAAASRCR